METSFIVDNVSVFKIRLSSSLSSQIPYRPMVKLHGIAWIISADPIVQWEKLKTHLLAVEWMLIFHNCIYFHAIGNPGKLYVIEFAKSILYERHFFISGF